MGLRVERFLRSKAQHISWCVDTPKIAVEGSDCFVTRDNQGNLGSITQFVAMPLQRGRYNSLEAGTLNECGICVINLKLDQEFHGLFH
jgi:hypothetical protein